MEDNENMLELLYKRALDYSKTTIELIKLKSTIITSKIISTFLSYTIVLILLVFFLFFVNLGLALWIGELFGKIYFGFFVLALVYGVIGCIFRFFIQKWFKRIVGNYIIRNILK